MRRAAKVDQTQGAIVDALRKAGCTVWFIGLPVDLLVGIGGRTLLMEVKTTVGKRNPKPAKHTELQREFMATWGGGPVATVCDAESALRAAGLHGSFPEPSGAWFQSSPSRLGS